MCHGTEEGTLKFSLQTHADILQQACSDLLSAEQLAVVVGANFLQDGRQFESGVHFDNCAFDAGIEYFKQEWSNVDAHEDRLNQNALTAFGRLTHTIQDFYAHSNWVELHVQLSPIPIWDCRRESLPGDIVSGTWLIGFPKKCPHGTPSHDDMNKDEPTTERGQQIVGSGPNQGQSLFAMARDVAIRATREQVEKLVGKAATPIVFQPAKGREAAMAGLDLIIKDLEGMLSEARRLRQYL